MSSEPVTSQRLITMPSVSTVSAPVLWGFIDSRGPVVPALGKPHTAKVVQWPSAADLPSVLPALPVPVFAGSGAVVVALGAGLGRAMPEVRAPPPASVGTAADGETESRASDWPGAQVSASTGQRPPVESWSPE